MSKNEEDVMQSLLEDMADDSREPEVDAVGTPTLEDLVQKGTEMEMLKEQIDVAEAELKVLKEQYDALRKSVIPDLMAKAGVSRDGKGSFTIGTGARISLRNDLHVGVIAEDKPALFDYLRRVGAGSLIREDVHNQTLKAYVREQLAEGKPIPPMVKQFYETSVTLTRGRRNS